ncbi:putative AFG1-like ATPase-1 [Elsinoe australis]|uniref:Putative AFG1-like ATPase-1 n=1 Tax=Elsinoe australis TaxID=40998 RepID=A0A4U7B2A3_9PEZI|nr:putative AFG1-like ATPase-1 [Elsinoe australis]
MGLIKKKTAVRTTEGGIKYICDICSADITATVRIRCADDACNDYDLCVPCFGEGKASGKHDPATHAYQVIEQHSIPIFVEDWGADEELLLLEGAETYGLGSWADIADHIGGYRFKDEVRDHYISTFVDSSKFPLPERASPNDTELSDRIPRDEFQARKKRRIEERKEAAKNAPPMDPKQKPTSSVPSCHEVQGYMPGRREFETEHWNEAEEAVQHMQFEPGDGINPKTGEMEPEMELKMTVMDIYNHRLTMRLERKKIIFEHGLLEYRKNTAIDKKRTKDERDLQNKLKPFARMLNHDDFELFCGGVEYEHNLRGAIAQLQEWRRMQITDLKAGERYEHDKATRLARIASSTGADRFALSGRPRPNQQQEPPSAATALLAPDLTIKPPVTVSKAKEGKLTNGVNGVNGHVNGDTKMAQPQEPKFDLVPLEKNRGPEITADNPDYHLLTKNEQEVCKGLKVQPKAYIVMKDAVMREALKTGGLLKKKAHGFVSSISATSTSSWLYDDRASLKQNIMDLHKLSAKTKELFLSAISVDHQYGTGKVRGPLEEYDVRVEAGRLRNDEHQRNLISALQDLHVMLASYQPPEVNEPTIESLKPPKKGLFSSIFGSSTPQVDLSISESLPKGLYMYGDVGSGKTMLMDLFYDTLPPNIKHKTRIHFHNFMQDVHKRLHQVKMAHGSNIDAIPFVAAQIASRGSVLCFDEFQCTDVADAMILRRLIQALMHHGVVLVTTSNRHPTDLYKNGVQRDSFIPCINLLLHHLRVLNLDSTTDYRKIPRPPSGVYHHPLDAAAKTHADHWFRFLGDFDHDPPHQAEHHVWGRPVRVPLASGKCARFTFHELLGGATGAADYIELTRSYGAFVVTDVPAMNLRSRDLARRFITFVDAVYESRAKLVLTSEKGLGELFVGRDEIGEKLMEQNRVASQSWDGGSVKNKVERVKGKGAPDGGVGRVGEDLEENVRKLKESKAFGGGGDEETFAFARALSRLSEMGSQEWVERGLGLEKKGGKQEAEGWARVRSKFREDSM